MSISSIDAQIKELESLLISTRDLQVRVETKKYIDDLYEEIYQLQYQLEDEYYEKYFEEFEHVFTIDSDQYK